MHKHQIFSEDDLQESFQNKCILDPNNKTAPSSSLWNKKVLLRERKRHTARRVAIAISCYSGEGGGSLDKKFFFQSEHVSSQIWCQKIFPLLGGVP